MLSSWLLYCKYVLRNKSFEKLISIFESKEKKSADEYGLGNTKLLYWLPNSTLKNGGAL